MALATAASDDQTRQPSPQRRPPPRRVRWGMGIGGVIILAVIIFLMLFQWNWLRGPLARAISSHIHRPVSITGNLEVHPWSWSPRATVNGLVIGNAPWAGPKPLATLPRLTVQVKLLPLLRGKVILPLIEADHPDVTLLRDASGRANWVFDHGPGPPKPLRLPAINHLIINAGALSYRDVHHHLSFDGVISSNEQLTSAGRGEFSLEGKGLLNGDHFVAHVHGGPLINVDPSRPYLFTASIDSGATRARMDGRIAHPFNFGALSGHFSVSGPDFADLYHLTGLALPNTPPYSLTAGFGRSEEVYAFRGIHGRVGASDLAGAITVDDSSGRPLVTADLTSRRLLFTDLTAVIGGVPKHTAGVALSPSQKIEAAKLTAEHRLLPDSRLDVSRVRTMDARLTYRAQSVDAGKLPIKGLLLKLRLDHGVLDIDPLDLTLPQGRLAGTIHLDARKTVPSEAMDMRLTNARLETLMGKGGAQSPIEGGLYARVKLAASGDSVRAAAARADGRLTLVIPGGDMRQAFAELLGIDATKGLFLLLAKNHGETPIRCAVADFQARNGVFTAQRIVLDTGVVLVTGEGDIDLRDETLNFTLKGKPKKFRLVRLSAPITLKGSLESPKIGVDVVKAAPQAALAVAVGVFAAPAAAILPFINGGMAKDADCTTLVTQEAQRGAPVRKR